MTTENQQIATFLVAVAWCLASFYGYRAWALDLGDVSSDAIESYRGPVVLSHKPDTYRDAFIVLDDAFPATSIDAADCEPLWGYLRRHDAGPVQMDLATVRRGLTTFIYSARAPDFAWSPRESVSYYRAESDRMHNLALIIAAVAALGSVVLVAAKAVLRRRARSSPP